MALRSVSVKLLARSSLRLLPILPPRAARTMSPSAYSSIGARDAISMCPVVANSVVPICPSPGKRPRNSFAPLDDGAHRCPQAPDLFAQTRVANPQSALNLALKSVVKVFCTTASPSFSSPWTMQAQTKSTATGFIIEPLASRRILTNAHAVANQCQVMLRKHGSAKKYVAKVLAVGHECDIAMLTVDDDEFWGGVSPLAISGLPDMQASVMVVGFPQGGDNVCVTKGVVSRIDRSQYSHGRTALLAVQIDAAINSGNSGGPVMMGDTVVGIAFQCLTAGENIGYIIPTPVINHFLQDLERNGSYTGFCELGASWQSLESGDMKRWLGMPANMTGVFITGTEPVFDASKVLQAGDVLTHVGGHEIADDGTFLFAQDVRIDFRHMVSMAFHGDVTKIKVWRSGQHIELPLRLSTPQQLVPVHSHDCRPKYFIYAGMVFTRLTTFYLRSMWGADWSSKAPIKLCDRTFAGTMQTPGQEVVLLSKVLAGEVNTGYQDTSNIQVHKVNGVRVHNLAHLAHMLTHATEPFVRFDLEWNRVVVIDNSKARATGADILRQNCIAGPASEGLLQEAWTLPCEPETVPSLAEVEEVEAIAAEVVAAAVAAEEEGGAVGVVDVVLEGLGGMSMGGGEEGDVKGGDDDAMGGGDAAAAAAPSPQGSSCGPLSPSRGAAAAGGGAGSAAADSADAECAGVQAPAAAEAQQGASAGSAKAPAGDEDVVFEDAPSADAGSATDAAVGEQQGSESAGSQSLSCRL